jgi:Sec-independent protein translocase protein TatA
MLKWLLLAALVYVVLSRRERVGDLSRAVRTLPRTFKDAKSHVEDPVAAAKPVSTPTSTRE